MTRVTGRHVLALALAAFGVVVAVNVLLAVNAVRTFSGVVVENSYVASQSFDAERAAQRALGWTLSLRERDGALLLDFADAAGHTVRPATLAVTVGRPTTATADETPPLGVTATGYVADTALAPGAWRVEVVATATGGASFRQSRALHVPGEP